MLKFNDYLKYRKLEHMVQAAVRNISENQNLDPAAVQKQILTLLNGMQDVNAKMQLIGQLIQKDLPALQQQGQQPPQQQQKPQQQQGQPQQQQQGQVNQQQLQQQQQQQVQQGQ